MTQAEDGKKGFFNFMASFVVFLCDNCTDGHTYFLLVEPPLHTDVETLYGGKVAPGDMDGEIEGVRFNPIQGSTVLWINLNKEGNRDRRLVHVGLPVAERGKKVGLNVWPRKYFGLVGDDGGRGESGKKIDREDRNGMWKE